MAFTNEYLHYIILYYYYFFCLQRCISHKNRSLFQKTLNICTFVMKIIYKAGRPTRWSQQSDGNRNLLRRPRFQRLRKKKKSQKYDVGHGTRKPIFGFGSRSVTLTFFPVRSSSWYMTSINKYLISFQKINPFHSWEYFTRRCERDRVSLRHRRNQKVKCSKMN